MRPLFIKFNTSILCEIMHTGYIEFESSTGICGLAKVTDGTLSILAVHATKKRTGQFRNFIIQSKRKFGTIEILEVWNLGLRDVLIRYGFLKDGDTFRWTKRKGKTPSPFRAPFDEAG